MFTFITFFHVVVALLLIFLVLIQDSKGGAMGMMGGGGGSQSILGATGAPTFFAKLTRYMAIIFAATSIYLTIYSSRSGGGSVIDDHVVTPAATTSAPVKADAPVADENKAAESKKTNTKPGDKKD